MRTPSADLLAARLARLRSELTAIQLDGLIVTGLPNIAYLTGFFASAAVLVVTPEDLRLLGDGRYAEPLAARAEEYPAIRSVRLGPGKSYDEVLVETLATLSGLRLGFEASHLTVHRHRSLRSMLAAAGWEDPLVETDGVVEGLRLQKDRWEIARLRDGGERLSSVAKYILSNSLAGRAEAEVAADIDARLRHVGFERPAFDTIVAAGPNAALPHGRAGQRQIADGDLVVLDFGGVLDGYCTDLTRTVTAGSTGARQRALIEQVIEAQATAFTAIRAGAAPESVDAAARDRLAGFGLDEAFTHGTGHGLGLEIHEAPRVTRLRPGHPERPLAAGMVMTLEPGVYFPGWGGVRIEDDVLVTEDGAEWLTDVPRMPT